MPRFKPYTFDNSIADGILKGVGTAKTAAQTALVPGTSDLTIEGWFKISGESSSTVGRLINVGAYPNGFLILFNNSTCSIDTYHGSYRAENYVSGSTKPIVPLNAWFHLAVTITFATSTCRTYINGTLASTATFNKTLGSISGNVFGRGVDSPSAIFSMARVRYYKRALSASEVLDTYQNDNKQSGCLIEWKMTDGSGSSTITDSSGNGFDGALANLVSYLNWYPTDVPMAKRGSTENLLLQSEDLTVSPWLRSNLTTSAGATDPNGGTTAFGVVEDNANNFKQLTQSAKTSGDNDSYVFSLYVKRGSRNWFALATGPGGSFVNFDLVNGAVGTTSISLNQLWNPQIEAVGNGWFKVSVSSYSAYLQIVPTNGNAVYTYAGDGSTAIYVWHPQVKRSNTPKAYVGTTSKAVRFGAPTLPNFDNKTIPARNQSLSVENRLGSASSYFKVADNAAFKTPSMSMECWMLDTGNDRNVTYHGLLTKTTNLNWNDGVGLVAQQSADLGQARNIRFFVNKYNGTTGGAIVSYVEFFKWTHLVATFDDSTKKMALYINGALKGTYTITASIIQNTASIIALQGFEGNAYPWQGNITRVKWYNRALTSDEVAKRYRNEDVFDGLVGAWNFSEGSGTTVADSVGGRNGTLVGSVGWSLETPNAQRGASQNFFKASEDLTDAAWTKSNVTIAANTIVAPDGTQTADALVDDAVTANRFVRQFASGGTSPYTISFYAKAINKPWLFMSTSGGGAVGYINLTDGSSGTGSTLVNLKTSVIANGWLKISATTTNYVEIYPATGNAGSLYAGDGSQSIALWGFQAKNLDTNYSYIKTTASTVPIGSPVVQTSRGATQNLLKYSNTFSNAAWTLQAGVSVTPNSTSNPVDGANNAWLLDMTGAGAATGLYQVSGVPNSEDVVLSIWIRSVSGSGTISFTQPVGSNPVVGTFTIGTDWQKITVTGPTGNPYASATGIWLRKGTLNQAYIYAAQIRRSQTPDSYVETTSSAIVQGPQVNNT